MSDPSDRQTQDNASLKIAPEVAQRLEKLIAGNEAIRGWIVGHLIDTQPAIVHQAVQDKLHAKQNDVLQRLANRANEADGERLSVFVEQVIKTDRSFAENVICQDGDRKILRKLNESALQARVDKLRSEATLPESGTIGVGAFIDTETMGLDSATDKIIQLSVQLFKFDSCGDDRGPKVIEIGKNHSWYNDPGKPIPPEITALTGITDDMVQGKSLPKDEIQKVLSNIHLMLAHNAAFDRGFLEAEKIRAYAEDGAPSLWGCTYRDPKWGELGVRHANLEALSTANGWFFDAHRADADTLAGVALLVDQPDVFAKVFDAAKHTAYRIWAEDSPFESKDRLKENGWKWDDSGKMIRGKAWMIEVDEMEIDKTLDFLREKVYPRKSYLKIPYVEVAPEDRFRTDLKPTGRLSVFAEPIFPKKETGNTNASAPSP